MPAKKEKAAERVKNFQAELVDFREQLDRIKKEKEVVVRDNNCMMVVAFTYQIILANRAEPYRVIWQKAT